MTRKALVKQKSFVSGGHLKKKNIYTKKTAFGSKSSFAAEKVLNVFVGGGGSGTASESSQLTVALRRANTGMPGSDTRGQLQQQVLDYGNEFA